MYATTLLDVESTLIECCSVVDADTYSFKVLTDTVTTYQVKVKVVNDLLDSAVSS